MKIIILFILLCQGILFATTDTQIIRNEAGKVVAQYSYEGQTLNLRTFYTYNAEGRLIEVASDNGNYADPLNFQGVTERFITSYRHHPDSQDQDHPIEILKKFVDVIAGEEQLISHTFNTYCKQNHLIQRGNIDSEGTYTHITFDKQDKPLAMLKAYKHGEQERLVFEYDKQGKLTSASKETREGITEVVYDKKGFHIINRTGASSDTDTWSADLVERATVFKKMFQKLDLTRTDKRLDQYYEEYSKAILGDWTYTASGFYRYPQRIGIYGNGEINDKVRVSLVNGILNDPVDHMQNLDLFCDVHGGVNIHYVFRPYDGFTKDILRCTFVKAGWVSPQARELAKKWKELIAEMGGVGQGGLIIHYAHSIGGTDTYRARNLMTPEELKMIRVITIGSATLIPNLEFQNVINYTSIRDGVSQAFDILSYMWGFMDPETEVVYLDTIWGVPMIDHMIANPAYNVVVRESGAAFVEKYGRLTN